MKRVFCQIALIISIVISFPIALGLCFHEGITKDEDKLTPIKSKLIVTYYDTHSKKTKKMDLEEYLVGVLAAEMPAEYDIEALKAQTVAARSFILRRANEESGEHPAAIVCTDPTHCKAYEDKKTAMKKWEKKRAEEYWDKLSSAVAETEGEYMICGEEVVEAFFFARSGGRTENVEDVWGEERPYLRSVESIGDIEHPELISEVRFTTDEVRSLLKGNGTPSRNPGQLVKIGRVRRTAGGGVAEIEIDGQQLKGTVVRSLFGLKSANFSISSDKNGIVFSVLGNGHGVGMSQNGANYMAKNGKNYTEILSHYYTNIQIVRM